MFGGSTFTKPVLSGCLFPGYFLLSIHTFTVQNVHFLYCTITHTKCKSYIIYSPWQKVQVLAPYLPSELVGRLPILNCIYRASTTLQKNLPIIIRKNYYDVLPYKSVYWLTIYFVHILLLLNYIPYILVCRGSMMVMTLVFQSGRPGSSLNRDHSYMRFDRGTVFIRAFIIPPG